MKSVLWPIATNLCIAYSGIGKTSSACILTHSLNHLNSEESKPEPCGT